MAITVTIETDIARPPDAVFAALTDVDTWPAWLIATGIISVSRPPGVEIGPGARMTIEQRAAGLSNTIDATVTALESPTHLAVEGRANGGATLDLDATLVALDGGSTRLRWSARIGVPLRYRAFESMASGQATRAAALDIEAFKRRLESTPSG